MKKIFGIMSLLAVMVATVGMVGCNSNKDKIVGKWKYYAKSNDGSEWKLIEYDNVAEFKVDGTVIIREEREEGEMELGWSIDGDKLILSRKGSDPYSSTAIIQKITDEEMVLVIEKNNGKQRYEKYKKVNY